MSNLSIILIEPQLGQNIGSCARAMKNFACNDLRIVNPRENWHEKALELSKNAKDIIENIKIYDNISQAIEDRDFIYATTSRDRNLNKKVSTTKDISFSNKTGILFGPERTGLTNEHVSFANEILTINVSDEYPSLNLAQSVGIICYEYFNNDKSVMEKTNLASKKEVESLVEFVEERLENNNFFKEGKKKSMMINIREIFSKEYSSQDISILRAILKN